MTIQETEIEEENNIIQLKLLLGGKQPPKKGDNWLSKINQWAFFTAKNDKMSKVEGFLYQVVGKYDNTTALTLFIPKEEPHTRYFSTIDFSEEYTLMDIIDNGDDGNYDRSNSSGGLEVNADIEQNHTVVGETGQS